MRRLIGDGKLAARLGGSESRSSPTDRECPICFLHYPQVNITGCCAASICTECYLQIRPPKEKSSACPFCNNPKLTVSVAKQMHAGDVQKREEEEQKVIEATIHARAKGTDIEGSPRTSLTSSTPISTPPPSSPGPGGFGSSLERQTSNRLRTRSSSADSDTLSQYSSHSNTSDLSSLAMTPEERRSLEQEMKAQHSHPLARRMQEEAEERRSQNEREFHRTNTNRIRQRQAAGEALLRSRGLMGGRRGQFGRMASDSRLLPGAGLEGVAGGSSGSRPSGRNWNQIVEAFEMSGRGGEVQSLDDLVVIEAAILLSMEEEAARRRAAATEAGDDGEATAAEGGGFDAAQHARAGFPLLNSLLSRRSGEANNADENNDSAMLSSSPSSPARRPDPPETSDPVSRLSVMNSARAETDRAAIAAAAARARTGRRSRFLRSGRAASTTQIETAGMLMQGISEEEQVAMAIALSLREESAVAAEGGNSGGEVGAAATSDGEPRGDGPSEQHAGSPDGETQPEPPLRQRTASAASGGSTLMAVMEEEQDDDEDETGGAVSLTTTGLDGNEATAGSWSS